MVSFPAEFRDRVQASFAEDARDFVVDFSETTGVDSAGLEALTWLKRECDERLGLLKLCRLSETLRKILELTRLDRQLDRCEDLDEALASLA
jgi:anti-anti-sigma factor